MYLNYIGHRARYNLAEAGRLPPPARRRILPLNAGRPTAPPPSSLVVIIPPAAGYALTGG